MELMSCVVSHSPSRDHSLSHSVNMENTITDYVMHSLRGNSEYNLCVCWLEARDTKETMTALLSLSRVTTTSFTLVTAGVSKAE